MKAVALAIQVLLLCCMVNYFHGKVLSSFSKQTNQKNTEHISEQQNKYARLMSLGFDQVLADLYWLAFVQYVGDTKERDVDHYADAENFLTTIISLDPQLTEAYYFAAFIIGSERKQPQVASAIIDRGIATNPGNWYLPFIAGTNQYLYAHNEHKAASYYRMAARIPDSPKWLEQQANVLEAQIPSAIKEINIWNSIYNSTSDVPVKKRARAKLVQLWANVYRAAPTSVIRTRALEQLRSFQALNN